MTKIIFTLLIFSSIPLFALDNTVTMSSDDMKSYSAETIRIHVTHNGKIILNDNDANLEILKTFFAEDPKNPDDLVLIIADEEVSKDHVLKVLDICCNYKYNNIELIYQPSWIKG